jgi:hypothetical protein
VSDIFFSLPEKKGEELTNIGFSMAGFSMAGFSMAGFSMIRFSMIRFSMIRFSMIGIYRWYWFWMRQ